MVSWLQDVMVISDRVELLTRLTNMLVQLRRLVDD
jgi:hypothetical protein